MTNQCGFVEPTTMLIEQEQGYQQAYWKGISLLSVLIK